MDKLFAGIHIENKPNEFMPLNNIDFQKNVLYLKEEIAGKIEYEANNIGILSRSKAINNFYFKCKFVRFLLTMHYRTRLQWQRLG